VSGEVEFVVDKVALGQVFSEYFDFTSNLHSTKFSILTITRGRYNRPEGADVPSGPSSDSTPTLLIYKKKKKKDARILSTGSPNIAKLK
jgi:hypothetical protein